MMLNQDTEVQGYQRELIRDATMFTKGHVQICEWLYNHNQNTLLIK